MNDWVLERLRTTSKRTIAAWAVACALVAAGAYAQRDYLRVCLLGPVAVDDVFLGAIADAAAAPKKFVRTTGTAVEKTGLQEITVTSGSDGKETSREVSSEYVALLVGGRYLLCKTPHGDALTQRGEILALPEDVDAKIFGAPSMAQARVRFYPFYLDDSTDYRTGGYWQIGLTLIFAGLAYFFLSRALRTLKDPAAAPAAKRLQAAGDPVGLAAQAEQEFKSPILKGKLGWVLTDRFLIRSTFFHFDIQRVADLVWVYKAVTVRRVNFIPVGKTFAVKANCVDGVAEIVGKEAVVDQFLRALADRAPWAVFGFAADRAALWKDKRADFVAAIVQRRAEHASAKKF